MAYDEALVDRLRAALLRRKGVTERKMFGGVCFMVNGHMCCGVAGKKLMVRVGPEHYAAALRKPHAKPMDLTGRPLNGFVFVLPDGIRTRQSLHAWLTAGLRFAASLPAKRS